MVPNPCAGHDPRQCACWQGQRLFQRVDPGQSRAAKVLLATGALRSWPAGWHVHPHGYGPGAAPRTQKTHKG